MGLKKFDNKLPEKKKIIKQMVAVLCICLIAVASLTSYAIFKVQHDKLFVSSKVGNFKMAITIMVDGEESDAYPEKDSDKIFEKIECSKGQAEWNEETWELTNINASGRTVCTVSFITESKGENSVDKLTELAQTNTTEMFTDEDGNIRYIGKDPANYVDLGNGNDENGEPILWRIIGIMSNIDDGTGNKETRLKVIRDKSLGGIAWDVKCKTYERTRCTSGYLHSNNWETASLNKTLNEAFYNSSKTTEINYITNFTSEYKILDFTSIGITEGMKSLIGDAVYHLGGPEIIFNPYEDKAQTGTASYFYSAERGNIVNSDNGKNPTTWKGKIGLIYPSDYGYATSGGNFRDKVACSNQALYSWDAEAYADCKNNDWLFATNPQGGQWTITPFAYNSGAVYYVEGNASYGMANGSVTSNEGSVHRSSSLHVYPVMYLKSDVKIKDGEGTKDKPYKIGI